MTNSNEPSHRPMRRQPSYRSTAPRTSVPSARDELERERELYSQHDPSASFMRDRVPNQQNGQVPTAGQQAVPDQHAQPMQGARRSRAGAANDHIAHSRVSRGQRPQASQPHAAQPGSSSAWNQHAIAGQQAPHVNGQYPPHRAPSESARMPRVAGNGTANGHAPQRRGAAQQPGMQHGQAASGRQHAQAGMAAPSSSQRMPRTEQGRAPRRRSTAQPGARPSAQPSQRMQRVQGQRPSAAQGQQRPVRRGASASQPSETMREQQQAQSAQQPPVIQNVRGNDASAYSRANYQRTVEGARKASPTNASTYQASRYLGNNNNHAPKQKANFFTRNSLIAVAVVAVIAVVGVFAFTNWMNTKDVQVTLNGDQVTISGNERSIGGLLDANKVSVTPGNYVAVDGSTIRQGDGTRCTAKVNGNETDDMNTHLNGGDKVEISNGTDITEPYTDSDPQTLPHKTELKGVGAVHLYSNNAQDGEQVTRTGKESGITATVTTKEPVDDVVQYYNINSNGDKVIALTFDDGPWDKQTDEILDILEENGAKATFFTVGQCISGHEKELQRAANMGCEIGTHTWDHAEGSGQGVSLIKMSSQERKDEVTKGLQAITNATGQEASTIFRCPGGNYDTSVATDLEGIVTAEIGWNIDTTDWKKPGADVIAQRIQSAGPGNIILMHDGGGDRSQTIAGLKQALPKLKEQGYTFVTVQDLIEKYPYQEGQSK